MHLTQALINEYVDASFSHVTGEHKHYVDLQYEKCKQIICVRVCICYINNLVLKQQDVISLASLLLCVCFHTFVSLINSSKNIPYKWFLPHSLRCWKHDMLACFVFESVCNPEFDKYIVEKHMYNNPDKAKLTKEKTF